MLYQNTKSTHDFIPFFFFRIVSLYYDKLNTNGRHQDAYEIELAKKIIKHSRQNEDEGGNDSNIPTPAEVVK